MTAWDFWIDAGGTFTDCIGRASDGTLVSCKVLSSGVYRGIAHISTKKNQFSSPQLMEFPDHFFVGYTITFLPEGGQAKVAAFFQGEITLDRAFNDITGLTFELSSGEQAPLVAIRKILGCSLQDPLPKLTLRLGTTRGTNALLERKGAKLAFLTTKGFADLVEIGTQARPDIFALNIKKPKPLYSEVIEVEERMDAEGHVRQKLNREKCRKDLAELVNKGIDTIAICLINAYKDPFVEEEVAAIAKEVGAAHISLSTRLSPTIKALDRGETAIVDAYLSPVLNDYIRSIHRTLRDSPFKMITSAGGLTDAHKFVGKDSLLSGPAGGVVGFAHVAREAGYEKSIGFDMGGTSTDVSRFDGEYEYQFSLKKAGVRLVSPMYAIETVAAGGGSICRFDGQKLTVGPESAGADPGPACYGRGGPLTVTDINVFNGKIDPDYFPLPLDIKAVEKKLKEISEAVKKAGGQSLSLYEIADGFTELANLKMANAIKTISSAKGYDPKEYCLVSFGGAGAQHACAIASSLGIQNILLHPFAGILSAYGVGMADVKRFAEKSVLKHFSKDELEHLEKTFLKLEKELTQNICNERVVAINIVRMLDLRYLGEDAVITVRGGSYDEFVSKFRKLHRQLYGHDLQGRAIEIAALRVEVVGKTEKPSLPEVYKAKRQKNIQKRHCYFNGRSYSTSIFQRDQIDPGQKIIGPAIVCESFSTIVIDPGWQGEMTARGNLVLTEIRHEAKVSRSSQRDPIRLELFSHHFTHIATQMGVTLQKASLSTNVKERLDFSCGILDKQGNLVVNAPHIPVHLGALGECVKSLLGTVKSIRPGDVFLSNDPNLGGSHLPDLTVITPVFLKGRLCFFTASRAHHAEIGGKYPGSFYPFAKTLEEEGVIFRHMPIVKQGKFDEEGLYKALTTAPFPSRMPQENIADIRAAIAANHLGERNLQAMIDLYSWEVVGSYMAYLCEMAEEKTREAIRQIPDGRYDFQDQMDDGSPICVQVLVKGSTMDIDFSGSAPVHKQSLNANKAIVQSAVIYCLRCMISEEIPLNAGMLAPISLKVPHGILNPPEEAKAAVAGGNVEVSQRVVDVFFGALNVAAASQGTMNNIVFGNDHISYYETICGGSGAGSGYDGADAVQCHMTNTRITDVEVLEQRYPVRLHAFQIKKGSGGTGKFCGGCGVIRKIEFLEKMDASLMTQRRKAAPFGLKGGHSGLPGKNLLIRADGTFEELDSLAQVTLHPGDILEIHTPGGGGFA